MEHRSQEYSTAHLSILLGTFAILAFVSCAPQKILQRPASPPDLVWYRGDISEAATQADLEACRSNVGPGGIVAGCMERKGYLPMDRPVAELLRIRELQKRGLSPEAIADRLVWDREKVGYYLDASFQLPETASLGRLPPELLARLGKPAVTPLIEALKEEDPLVRRQAATALGQIGDQRAAQPLIARLKDKDSLIRGNVVQALGRIKDPSAVPPLISVLNNKEEEPHVRMSAAEALGAINDPRAVEPLILALLHEHWGIRSRAAQALGKLKDTRAVGPLIGALQDKEGAVRANAAESLGELGERRAVRPLTAALDDTEREVRKKAALALRKLTGKEFKAP